MNESAASTTLKRIALFKVNKVPYLLELNINWAAATHLTRWTGKAGSGPNHCEEGGGGTQLFRKALFAFVCFSTYKIILGIYTYFFTIESDFF